MDKLIEGGAVGLMFQEGAKPVEGLISKGMMFKSTRTKLASTLEDVIPVFQEMKIDDDESESPDEETTKLLKGMEEEKMVLSKYSNVPLWKFCLLPCYQSELQKACERVERSINITMQPGMARDIKKIKKTLLTMGNINDRKQLKGQLKAPVPPEWHVGLNSHLRKLKMELLETGVSVLVLTGLAGSGKSTLASLLCSELVVKGTFGGNILFVRVSSNPSLKEIVQKLFQHYDLDEPDLRGSDGDAVTQLKELLGYIGKNPIMLVLDDVWPSSDYLIEAFRVNHLSHYKIVVTSRAEFLRYKTSCRLERLSPRDSVDLFRHVVLPEASSNVPDEDLIQKVAESCNGSPRTIVIIGRILSRQPHELWLEKLSQGPSHILPPQLLASSEILDVLDDNLVKQCFMDLGLFPKNQKIPVNVVIDMWVELYGPDHDGIRAISIINKLESQNLAKVLIARRNASVTDNHNYNYHCIELQNLQREFAIYQSIQEPIEKRERLIFDINVNRQEWELREKQQGMIARIFSRLSVKQKPLQLPARTLSISTDGTCAPFWSTMLPTEVEVLILNLQAEQYSFPEWIETMSKLKVLIVTKYGLRSSQLNKFELLVSLSNLKRIRLERISVPSLGKLENLQKLSLHMCDTSEAFEDGIIQNALPNLEELNIDYCKDIVEFPTGVCGITRLKTLSITNCHKLSSLPEDIGNLENLKLVRLSSCSDLKGIPNSVARLSNLTVLDISDCTSLTKLPEDIGNLSNLRNLYMTNCDKCELPSSVLQFQNLKVICDQLTATSWEAVGTINPSVKVEVPEMGINLIWLGEINS